MKSALDGKDVKVTFVEVTLEPGQASASHRHRGYRFEQKTIVPQGDRCVGGAPAVPW